MIRIVIADDHLLFRSMLEEILKRDPQLEVIGTCADGEEVLANYKVWDPDLILLDIGMPKRGGIETLKTIKEKTPQIKVVMLTTFEDNENIKTAIAYGADGYLIKDMRPETLIMSIKCIHNDMVLFHESVFSLLQNAVRETQGDRNKKIQVGDLVFDAAEVKILQLIVQGRSNRDIGTVLNYSEGTIKNKVSKMLAQTGLADRTELSVFAISHELV